MASLSFRGIASAQRVSGSNGNVIEFSHGKTLPVPGTGSSGFRRTAVAATIHLFESFFLVFCDCFCFLFKTEIEKSGGDVQEQFIIN